ncbi:MAG TPA: hypothetical protein VHG08_17920 [Longimicrobium sp.]|nr:hypothetical protein [Longimicrobium sp.]
MRSFLTPAAALVSLLIIAAPADAQVRQVSGVRWRELLELAHPGAPLPQSTLDAAARTCARELPDSVMLATPTANGPGNRGHVSVWIGEPDPRVGWQMVDPPPMPDTLRAAVFASRCESGSGGRRDLLLVLEVDGRFLEYRPPMFLLCSFLRPDEGQTCEQLPMLRGFGGGRVYPLVWVQEQGRLVGEPVLVAERIRRVRSYGWSQRIVQLVLERRIELGMNTDMVLEAWGYPERTTRSVSRHGTRETWFYPGVIIHFTDGRVESWTEHN